MSGRKPNTARIESMLRWYEVACADGSRPADADAVETQLEASEGASALSCLPIERQMKIILIAIRHLPRFAVIDQDRLAFEEATYVEWATAIANELPDDDDLMGCDEASLRILAEQLESRIQRRKGSTGRRDINMNIYATAAALFNQQLEYHQKLGLRLAEKPTTAAAMQRAVARYKAKGSV